MKKVALAIAATLVLAVVAPAFSQPFADVPTDHWAFDAIAELAAKGIVEGYPDGTFKGDRAMTRYEMAMVVARILARIEAIKIPAPTPAPKIPAPEVTRRDIQALQRLINEFRAELAALGVRVTAVEEELAALRARLDNTFITGDYRYVYTFSTAATPAVASSRIRLTFRGRVGSHTAVFLRARWYDSGTGTSTPDFDRLLFTYAAPFGVTFTLGRDYWGLGSNQILLWGGSSRQGVRAVGTFGPVTFTALAFNRQTAGTTASTTYGFRGSMRLIPGWTTAFNYRANRDPLGVGSTGSGWSVDWSGNIIPGLTFSGEYASWTPTGGAAVAALFANFGIGSPILPSPISGANIWYKNYGAAYPTEQVANFTLGGYWLGYSGRNVTAWGGDVSFNVTSALTATVAYEVGLSNDGTIVPAGSRYSALLVTGSYSLGHNASLNVEYYTDRNTTAGTLLSQGFALYLLHRW